MLSEVMADQQVQSLTAILSPPLLSSVRNARDPTARCPLTVYLMIWLAKPKQRQQAPALNTPE